MHKTAPQNEALFSKQVIFFRLKPKVSSMTTASFLVSVTSVTILLCCNIFQTDTSSPAFVPFFYVWMSSYKALSSIPANSFSPWLLKLYTLSSFDPWNQASGPSQHPFSGEYIILYCNFPLVNADPYLKFHHKYYSL